MEPLVSICIPTRNQAGYLPQTLASAFGQTHPNLDVVVCDDASTDATAKVVEDFAVSLPVAARGRLRYVRNAQALGIGGNFDRAVREGRGAFAVKVDSDDILEPAFVERLLGGLQANPRAGWAHCNVAWFADGGAVLGAAHTRKRTGFEPAAALAPAYLQRSDTCHCVLLRREAYEAAGGYRREMKTCEDWLLWIEMILRGYGCYYDGRTLARMRRHTGRAIMSQRRLDYIDSIGLMAGIVERAWTPEVERRLAIPQAEGVGRLRHALAESCLDVYLDEASREVRQALLDAYRRLEPADGRPRLADVYAAMPLALLRGWRAARRWPRDVARRVYRTMRGGRDT